MDIVVTWISTVGTLVAIATSLYLLRQGQQDRRQLHEDQIRQQAERITAWADWLSTEQSQTGDEPLEVAIFVHNASGQVAYDVFADYLDPARGGTSRIAYGPLPPGTTARLLIVSGDPRDHWEPAAAFVELYFQDASGRRWYRTSAGRLWPDPGPGHAEEPLHHLWRDDPQRPVLLSSPAGR